MMMQAGKPHDDTHKLDSPAKQVRLLLSKAEVQKPGTLVSKDCRYMSLFRERGEERDFLCLFVLLTLGELNDTHLLF